MPWPFKKKPWALPHTGSEEQATDTNRCPRSALKTPAIPDSWILGSPHLVLALFGDSIPSLYPYLLSGISPSLILLAPCISFPLVPLPRFHTQAWRTLPHLTRPKVNVRTQRIEQRLEGMGEMQGWAPGGRKRKKTVRHRAPCLGWATVTTEATPTLDKPWVSPAERDIPNTLCPLNNYGPLRAG